MVTTDASVAKSPRSALQTATREKQEMFTAWRSRPVRSRGRAGSRRCSWRRRWSAAGRQRRARAGAMAAGRAATWASSSTSQSNAGASPKSFRFRSRVSASRDHMDEPGAGRGQHLGGRPGDAAPVGHAHHHDALVFELQEVHAIHGDWVCTRAPRADARSVENPYCRSSFRFFDPRREDDIPGVVLAALAKRVLGGLRLSATTWSCRSGAGGCQGCFILA